MEGSITVIGVRFDPSAPLVVDRASVAGILRSVTAGSRAGRCREAALVSGVDRTELHLVGADPRHAVEQFHRARCQVGSTSAEPFVHVGREALEHVVRVAAGLDAVRVGVGDGLEELQTAAAIAERAGTLGPVLRRTYRRALEVGEQCRSTTTPGLAEVVPIGRASRARLLRLADALAAERIVRVSFAQWEVGA